MRWQEQMWLLAGLDVTACLVSVAIVVISVRRARTGVGAVGLAVAMTGGAGWAAVDLLVTLGRVQLSSAVLPFVAASVIGFYVLARAVADPAWRPGRLFRVLAPGYVLLLGALAVADPWTGWVFGTPRPSPHGPWAEVTFGPGYWLHCALGYPITGAALAALARSLRNAGELQRRQAVSMLVAASIPTVATLVVTVAPPGAVPEFSSACFALTGAIDAWAFFRTGLLTLAPVARGLVLDRLGDAVVVIDPAGRILDVNAAADRLARQLAPALPARLEGVPARDVVRGHGLPARLVDGEYTLGLPGGPHVFDVRVERLADRRGRALAVVVVARDVTETHRQRAELAAANDRLREQLVTIEGLRQELARQATHDELTGLSNRRRLVAGLDEALAHARATGEELSVVLLDIDHFKSVNDTHGHAVGDALLVACARALASAVREDDLLARYGGEEFVLVLPGADAARAVQRAEECRARCAVARVESPDGPVRRTISLGVATLSRLERAAGGPVTPAVLLNAADEALYRAKETGRDRVVLAAGVPSA